MNYGVDAQSVLSRSSGRIRLCIGTAVLGLSVGLLASLPAQASLFSRPLFSSKPSIAAAAPITAATISTAPVSADDLITPDLQAIVDRARARERVPRIVETDDPINCVQYVRAKTGLNIFGNAKLWWSRGRSLYDEFVAPKVSAVMVFAGNRRMRDGHVAIVRSIVSAREIKIDHANWGNDGDIYLNMPVEDVSRNNDWSRVRVWDTDHNTFGTHVYAIKGFIARSLAALRGSAGS